MSENGLNIEFLSKMLLRKTRLLHFLKSHLLTKETTVVREVFRNIILSQEHKEKIVGFKFAAVNWRNKKDRKCSFNSKEPRQILLQTLITCFGTPRGYELHI